MNYDIAKLEDIFRKYSNPADTMQLCSIFRELEFRSGPRAQKLKENIQYVLYGQPPPQHDPFPAQRIHKQSKPQADTAPKPPTPPAPGSSMPAAKIHRMGTGEPNAPLDGYRPPLKTGLSLSTPNSTEPVKRYLFALRALVKEMKANKSSHKRYPLVDGKRENIANDLFLYHFPFHENISIFEKSQITIHAGGKKSNGNISRVGSGTISIKITDDFGETITQATLLIDDTALLIALIDLLDEKHTPKTQLNHSIAKSVVGSAPQPSPKAFWQPQFGNLTGAQRQVVEGIAGKSVLYVWGPPGTGKTRTLGQVVKMAFDKDARILVCSNTNRAVDEVIYKICDDFGNDHPAMQDGKIVRVGAISNDKLREYFTEFVTEDRIFERKGGKLQQRKIELEKNIAELSEKYRVAKQAHAMLQELDKATNKLQSLINSFTKLNKEHKSIEGRSSSFSSQINRLKTELQKRRTAWFPILKRSEAAIIDDLRTAKTKYTTARKELASIEVRQRDIATQGSVAKRRYERAVESTRDLDRKIIMKQISQFNTLNEVYHQEIKRIAKEISRLKVRIKKDARLLGMTCTKAYLSAADYGKFDLVIIDEASMVLLPILYAVAGLSVDRVLVSGDFRQLPPIIESDEKAIHDTLGIDVFTATGLDNPVVQDGRRVDLMEQHRMSAGICGLISGRMYEGRLRTAGSKKKESAPFPRPYNGELTVVDTSGLDPFESVTRFGSRHNVLHALLVRNLVWLFDREEALPDGEPERLGVCTPYAAQMELIQRIIDGEKRSGTVQVGTVHRFQGDERDMMVLEIPESEGRNYYPGIMIQGSRPNDQGARCINVAVSRAKNHLVIIGNILYLDKKLPRNALLRHVIREAQQRGQTISGSDLLSARPIDNDLRSLLAIKHVELSLPESGIFSTKSFEMCVSHDITSAKSSIVIFSAFFTERRVSTYLEQFYLKIREGVHIRCVTRPPERNGRMDPESSRNTLKLLEDLGVTIDLRSSVHEKVVIIDGRVTWFGSLNALSYTDGSEMMTRCESVNTANAVMSFLSIFHKPNVGVSAQDFSQAENPRCAKCGSRTVYTTGKYGPLFSCENRSGKTCDWTQNA